MAITELKTKQSNMFTLDRCTAVPSIIGDSSEFLIIAGLSGTAKDIGQLTDESPNAFLLGGAMGAAVTMALGLALSQPDQKVLAVFGDGECLMNSSSLSTVGFVQPNNLSLLCVDNGTYGETGNQLTHTANNADLEMIANGSGIEKTMTVTSEADYGAALNLLHDQTAPTFVLLSVHQGDPPNYRRNFDAVERKTIFRRHLLS